MKSLKRKFCEWIPMPSFLAYPSHRVKVFAKHIYSIVNDGNSHKFGCTKEDALKIKKYWGYMIKNNRNKSLEEFQHAIKVHIEHMFNNNCKCSAKWCFNKIALEEVKEYNKKTTNSVSNKTKTSCTSSLKKPFFRFKQTNFWENQYICLTQKKLMSNAIAYDSTRKKWRIAWA